MRARSVAWLAIVSALLLLVVPGVSADLEAPTMTEEPTLDGDIGVSEWSGAERYNFSAPRSGTSSVWLGYLDGEDKLAIAVSLSDDTDVDEDNVTVRIAPREVSDGDAVDTGDRKVEIDRDEGWTYWGGTSDGNWSSRDSGSSTGTSDNGELEFELKNLASSWRVEGLVEIGAFDAGDEIWMSVSQSDVKTDGGDAKTSSKGSSNDELPAKWSKTVLPGIPAPVSVEIRPRPVEAAVGADVVVDIPSDADGGRLSVEVNRPGSSGFKSLDSVGKPNAGENVFSFLPEKTGDHRIRAVWEGDGEYANETTDAIKLDVKRPSPAGPTVLATGALRVAFPLEAAGSPATWQYTNTHVEATDGSQVLELERLDSKDTCRDEDWVGIANTDQGSVELEFEPAVDRAALALTSPEGSFSAKWKVYSPDGSLLDEASESGSCSDPALASLSDVSGDVKRIEISYSGKDVREVVDVLFPVPKSDTEPALVLGSDPSPIHAGGPTTIQASTGYPYKLTSAEVDVTAGGEAVASRRCTVDPAQVWIDCPVNATVPEGASSVQVAVSSTDETGESFETSGSIVRSADAAPPKPHLSTRPLTVPSDTVVNIQAEGEDASGVRSIQLQTLSDDGEVTANQTCRPTEAPARLTCTLSLRVDEGHNTRMQATFTDGADNTRTIGPKPIPIQASDDDGDGLPNDLELEIGTEPGQSDTDGDGLNDGWEVVGVDRNGDGRAELDLASLGANPRVRDLFVEVDWARTPAASHEPAFEALQLVRNVLASRGIHVHFDIQAEGGPFDPARYDHGHAVHRNEMDTARAGIFYHLIASEEGGPAAGQGNAIYLPTPAEDDQDPGVTGARLLHELGHHLGLGHGGGGEADGKQVEYIEDHKPNYLSVMNNAYAWGVPVGTSSGTVLAPSLAGLALSDLDETNLTEPEGIRFDEDDLQDAFRAGPTPFFSSGDATRLQLRYTCPSQGPVRWASIPGPVDWNCNGATGDTDVSADINRGGANSGNSTLVSRTDWDALNFRGPPCPHFALALTDAEDQPANLSGHEAAFQGLGLAPCPLHESPTTQLDGSDSSHPDVPLPPGSVERPNGLDDDGDGTTDEGFADDDQDGIVNVIDGCPTQRDSTQTDRNRDSIGDRCQAPPSRVDSLQVQADGSRATLEWLAVQGAWGYNVYKVSGDVTHMGDFPTTNEPTFSDGGASTGDTYLVAAVDALAREGPVQEVTFTGETTGGGTGDEDQPNGNESGEKSVPGVGTLVAASTAAGAAWLRRRRG